MTVDGSKESLRLAIASRVRQNAFAAGVAAALMLYFGNQLVMSNAEGAFGLGDKLSIHTLRIGGLAMAAVAAASLSGNPLALRADAACSVIIGGLFAVSGLLMMTGGGTGFLYLIFGAMFIVAGVRNGRDAATFPMIDDEPSEDPPPQGDSLTISPDRDEVKPDPEPAPGRFSLHLRPQDPG